MTNSGFIRVPNATTYAQLPFEERKRLYDALKSLVTDYAITEMDRTYFESKKNNKIGS